MIGKVLFVDDEPSVLEAIRRTLGRKIDLAIAIGPAEGLRVLADAGPFAVVVSDMRMPGMSGAQFLAEVCRQSPNTVRMILSGQADLEATIAAVNEGHIFRFLSKPCAPEPLLAAVESGLDQYHLIMAEKELLEQTLSGAVQVLTEILAIVNPEAYGRASRITRYAEAMASTVEAGARWQVRLAAMLSQIGWVALPEEVVAKVVASQKLDEREQQLFDQHRSVAAKLISNIPRLGRVAAIIAGTSEEREAQPGSIGSNGTNIVPTGRAILDAATEFERLIATGRPRQAALRQLAGATGGLPPGALEALASLQETEARFVRKAVGVKDLVSGMVLDEDIVSTRGLRLVRRGQEVTPTLITRLRSLAEGTGVIEPIRVQAPA